MVKILGNVLLAVAALVAMTLHADAAEPRDRVLDGKQPSAELQRQIEALRQQAAEQGVEISDIQIRLNSEASVAEDRPAFGCTVSRYQSIDEMPGEVHIKATAPTCLDALRLLEEV